MRFTFPNIVNFIVGMDCIRAGRSFVGFSVGMFVRGFAGTSCRQPPGT